MVMFIIRYGPGLDSARNFAITAGVAVVLSLLVLHRQEEELRRPQLTPAAQPGSPAVLINNGSFAWEAGGIPLLRHLSLEVPAGHLLIVIGEVGSGR